MNPLSYYDRIKEPWTQEETLQVKKEYETDLLNIVQIGDAHKRTPGSIMYKLKNLGLIVFNETSRGYREYKTSKLYSEVCDAYDKKKDARKTKKEEKERNKTTEETVVSVVKSKSKNSDILLEMNAMKEEIKEMKKDIKQMLHYITSMYEFETSE